LCHGRLPELRNRPILRAGSADDHFMDIAVLTVALGTTFAIALGVSRLVLGLVLTAIVRRD
jgi:uncharacterized membrane protein (DUF485 family)